MAISGEIKIISGLLLFLIAFVRNFNKINKSPSEIIEQPTDRYSLKNTGCGPANVQPSTSVDIAKFARCCKSFFIIINFTYTFFLAF